MENICHTFLAALLTCACLVCSQSEALEADSAVPADGAVVYTPHPHFRWHRSQDEKLSDVYHLQIARDLAFNESVCDERLEVVSRFVPVMPLTPGAYVWRVRRADGEWTQAAKLSVRLPERVLTVRAGSDEEAVARIFRQVAAQCPARVEFEPGEYRLTAGDWRGVAALRAVHDVTVDGQGASITLKGTFLSVLDCQRVTIQNFTVTGERPGHTLVRVLNVDAARRQLIVRPEPGYDADVPRFFGGQGFLNRVDPARGGRHLGGFISTQEATAVPCAEQPGAFVIAPASEDALRRQEAGALSVLTRYEAPFVVMKQSDECTFSRVTLVDLPGAFCGGDETSAKSYLACKVLCRTPQDYQGGHAAVGDGRIGEWIEGCEFNRLADDGPNVRTMRMVIRQASSEDAVTLEDSWTNTDLRPGDTVALVNPKDFRAATADVRSVTSHRRDLRVQLDRPLDALAARMGVEGWPGAFLYRVKPSCEDFVYRRNRHVGGRGHGVKFNGARGWIADNHFENITGNAVEVGYSWRQGYEGFGACDVVISGNTVLGCGWTPISSHSPTALGGRLVIRGNRVSEVRDAAVSLSNCRDVAITGNLFESTRAPAKGAWVIAEGVEGLCSTNNRFAAGVPELRAQPARR